MKSTLISKPLLRICRAGLLAVLAGLAACSSAPSASSASSAAGAAPAAVAGAQPLAFSLAGPARAVAASEPLVVLQSGLGDGMAPWAPVAGMVAARHAVFSYDRPGYGASPATTRPRDPCTVAQELHQQLQAAHQAPPYLLVGHSLGGLYQHAFARLYPEEVAGLLLLDPTHHDHLSTMQADVPALAATVQAMRWTLFGATARREFDDQAICRERLIGPPARPVPTRLLASTRREPLEQGAFEAMLEKLRSNWLALTGAVQVERVAGSGHYLQTDQPERVAQAIEAMLQAASQRQPAALVPPAPR